MSQIIKKSKGKSCTTSQKEAIVYFIKQHPELNKGKFTQNFTKKHSQALWQELAKHLHTLVGAVKTPQQWRKVSFIDIYPEYLELLITNHKHIVYTPFIPYTYKGN